MNTSRNYWPIGVTLTLSLFFLGTIGLIVMSCMERTDLVTNNYYEDEIRFQKQIDRVERASLLETKATAAYDRAGQKVTISLPIYSGTDSVQGQIQLYRPSDAGLDQDFNLRLDAHGAQVIDASRLRKGLWRVKVSWTAGGADYYFDQKIVVAKS